jgi:hypothetical protein
MSKPKISPIFILAIVLFCVTNTNSQTIDGFVIKFTPTSLIDPVGSDLQLGCEYLNSRKTAIETDLGFYFPRMIGTPAN